MGDFYFAYNYNPAKSEASKLCRHIDHTFQRYDANSKEWVDDPELSRIFVGDDVFYDEITQEEAARIIEKLIS